MKKKNVVVIGAGIVGSCCALRMACEGYSVTLLDNLKPGNGCSFGNAGGISSASIIPMAIPGIWKKVPAWLFDSDGPLSVRWRHLLKVSPWLLRWIMESGEDRSTYSSKALKDLNNDVLNQYKKMLGTVNFNNLIRTTGHLHVFKQKPSSKGDFFVKRIREEAGICFEEFFDRDVNVVEPSLSKEVKYAILINDASYTVSPHRLVNTLVEAFEEMGGNFVQDHAKEVVASEYGVKVITRLSALEADYVVICAGALSKELMKKDLSKVKLENERGYHVNLVSPNFMPNFPIVSGDYKFFSTPMEDGLRLAGTVEISGLRALPDWSRADILLRNAKRIFPDLSASGSEVWFGDRPSFPSSIPLIDVSPVHENIFYAFGHGHYGMSGAPGTAEIIANMIKGKPQKVDISPFSYSKHI